jgi:hypothetical protein
MGGLGRSKKRMTTFPSREGARCTTGRSQGATIPVEVIFAPEVIEVVARRAAEIVLAEVSPIDGGRWLTGAKAAAAHLGCSPKRVSNRLHEIPHVKEGGRLMFHTAALDEWLDGLAS